MKIKLQRLGGLLPITREATTEVDWSDDELQQLLKHIRAEEDQNTMSRDATSDFLEVKGEIIPVNTQKVPAKFKAEFEKLKGALKPVKPK